MVVKTIEVRDRATFIPMLAIKLEPADERDRYLLARSGYGVAPEVQARYVVLVELTSMRCQHDAYSWGSARTIGVVHLHLEEHFDDVPNGAVIDVQFLLGETPKPKRSEALDYLGQFDSEKETP
jgi:hypothetical protein